MTVSFASFKFKMNTDSAPSTSKKGRYDENYYKPAMSRTELISVLEDSSDDEVDYIHDSDWQNESEDSGSNGNSQGENLSEIQQFLQGDNQNQNEQQLPQANDFTWSERVIQPDRIPFTGQPGFRINPNGNAPIDYFNLVANNDFYELVISNTNDYAIEILSKSETESSRISFWKDLTAGEFKTFLGLLFHMGTIKLNRINDYWKTNPLFSLPVFANYMSRNRFILILRALHFCVNTDEAVSKLYKISPLIDFFNDRMAAIYYPKREITIDESLVLWRGRLQFRQYIKGKRHKFGIKLYILTEYTGIIQKLIVYGGSQDRTIGGRDHTQKVVLKLMESHMNTGHALYMDNFYNSVHLTKRLLEANTYVTGTLRQDKKGNPKNLMTKKIRKNQVASMYSPEGICITKWKDKREICMISSEFCDQMTATRSRRGIESEKPELIVKYNKYKVGIDLSDQMLSYYSCEHKCIRWYKKIGIHIFQIMLNNAHFLYNNGNERKMSLYDFRLSVIESLLGPSPQSPRVRTPSVGHLPQYCPKGLNNKTKRRRCKYCWDTSKIRKDSIFYCPQCPNEPGLCLENCFRLFHENLHN